MLQKPAFDRLKKGKKMEPNDTKTRKKIQEHLLQPTKKNTSKWVKRIENSSP
jgi:hypothetical protein